MDSKTSKLLKKYGSDASLAVCVLIGVFIFGQMLTFTFGVVPVLRENAKLQAQIETLNCGGER